MRLRLAAPALVLLLSLALPYASARETLADLEEPHTGDDKLWDVTVLPEEAGKPRALVFRNPVRNPFGFVIYNGTGSEESFVKNGSRGVQTLPALAAGDYRFFVRGAGSFQVTDRTLARGTGDPNVSTTLSGTTDAYVLAVGKAYTVRFEGDVTVEWFDMTKSPDTFEAPAERESAPGGAYVVTVRGAEGAAYAIKMEEHPVEATKESPAPTLVLLLGAVGVLALLRRR